LLAAGKTVVGYDNLSTGMARFLTEARRHPDFSFVEADILDLEKLTAAMQGADIVFHLAANADVRFGLDHPRKDLDQNTIATFNVLEAMRASGVRTIAFSSTGSIYGEATVIPTPEDAPFPVQTSLYGASKLAGEGLIAAYAEGYGLTAYIFRFVSILGEGYTHGHVFDFCGKLTEDPETLHVLGNGRQRKSYLYVQDCIDAMLHAIAHAPDRVNIFNLGTDEYVEVNDSIGWITRQLGVTPKLVYSGGERGWVGDNPFIFLDTTKIRSLGWKPRLTINESIAKTVSWLLANSWVYGHRA
jgi:UDP-glucose 4-epimerase